MRHAFSLSLMTTAVLAFSSTQAVGGLADYQGRAEWTQPAAPSAVAARTTTAKPVATPTAQPVVAPSAAPLAQVSVAAAPKTDRLVVRYRDNSNGRAQAFGVSQPLGAAQITSAGQASLARAGIQALEVHHSGLGAQVIRLDKARSVSSLQALAQQMMADDPNILYAEPDLKAEAFAVPTDPFYGQQWHYFEASGGLNLPNAWSLSTGDGIKVAVVDTGVLQHADLAANLLPGADLISTSAVSQDGDGRDQDPTDVGDACNGRNSSWHGTHVSGTIAAVANNGIGGTGVAPNAKIVPVRVLGCGGGYGSDIADGIAWAAGAPVPGVTNNANPVRVINLSLGGQSTTCPTIVQTAIDTARSRGAVVVVAAGNSNASAAGFYPANCKGVITVAAVGRNGGKAPYSNTGANVDVAAPGGNMATGSANGVLSTLNSGTTTAAADNYVFYQGTSMATPHVAGAAALLLARRPNLLPYEVETLLRSNTRAFPATCTSCGTGIVDANKLVQSAWLVGTSSTVINEVEPNNTHATAQAITSFPATVRANMSVSKELDIYKVNVPVNATLSIRLIPSHESNYDLEVRNATGATVLVSSKKAVGLVDSVTWKNTGKTAVDVYPRVIYATGGTGTVNGAYTLEINR